MLAILLLVATACALQQPLSRRSVAGALAWAAAPPRGRASTRESLLGEGSDERCENGEGAACERLAEDIPIVRQLQEKSRVNKEKNAVELFDKTVRQLGYSDFFDAIDKNLVQLPNGTYTTLSGKTYTKLRKEGRIDVGAVDRVDFNALGELTDKGRAAVVPAKPGRGKRGTAVSREPGFPRI